MSTKTRILVVDDEPTILRFLRPALAANDYEVATAGTVADATKRIASEAPDVVVLDLGLPDGDGKEVIRAVRQWSDLPIIVLSARDRESEKIDALDLGADDFINKPFGVGELMARLRTAMRHRMQRHAEIPVVKLGEIEIDNECLPAGPGQDVCRVHRHRRAAAQEHRAAGASLSGTFGWCSTTAPRIGALRQTLEDHWFASSGDTYCRTKDGVNLAVACIGQGMSLVRAAHWITHVEYEWQNPLRVPLLHFLADHFHLIRYDSRGTGLSDWDVADVSFEALEQDLETVVDALGLRSYALLGISQGAALSIVHAIRYPRRVSKMVLLGGYASGQNMLKRFGTHAQLQEAPFSIHVVDT